MTFAASALANLAHWITSNLKLTTTHSKVFF
jgi:hypothetical protein